MAGDESEARFRAYIPGKGYDVDDPIPPAPDMAVISEIAARLLDLRDVDRRKPIRIINQLSRIWRNSPSLMWIALEILASNRQGGKSLAQIGHEVHFTKQAIHQEQLRELEVLADIMPEVSSAIRIILGRHKV